MNRGPTKSVLPERDGLDHLYVHVPFCDGKCDYCAFYSVVADAAVRKAYAALPGRELGMLAGEGTRAPVCGHRGPRTLYVGGGTPSLLGAHGLRAMAEGLQHVVALDAVEEWTVELNPAGVTRELAETLRALGVNRVSMGAQCFDDGVLRAVGRRHATADVARAVAVLRDAGIENVGLDLIAGLPGLADAGWRSSLARALELAVRHVSVYALGVEAGTELRRRVDCGMVTLPDAEAQLAALAVAERMLGDAGLARYEISNFAKPGWECRHNLACWRGEDYVGLGPSASSRSGLRRWTNRADLPDYLARVRAGASPARDAETCDAATDAVERLVFAFRLAEGVQLDAFVTRHPAAAPRLSEWQRTLEGLRSHGVVACTAAGAWRLTARGREVADAVSEALL